MLSMGTSWLWSQFPLLFSIIGGLLSIIGIILKMRSDTNHLKMISNIIIVVGGVLTLASAIGTTVRQSAQQALLESRTAELLSKSDKISSLSKQIIEKSDKITDLNRELNNSVIGGNSFCYFVPLLKQGIASLTLMHHGTYPLYDVTFRVHDLDKSKAFTEKGINFNNFLDDVIFEKKIGTLIAHEGRIFKEFIFQPKEILRFNIFFSARNGGFNQCLRIRRIGNEWKSAFKVVKYKGNKEQILLQNIDPGYPLNEKGVVQW
jgi:hypothetical protein